MTAATVRPPRWQAPPVAGWEWHICADDGWAHLYFGAQLRGEERERNPLVRPWCEVSQRFPLDHARHSVSENKVIPQPGRICPGCAAQNEHRRVELPCQRGGARVRG